jgi:hypothetical protein
MTDFNENIVDHKRSLGNDFVSAGFSISRNEITTITEPRYTQRVSIHSIGSTGKTIIELPDINFTTASSSPYNIIGADIQGGNSGLFDSSMTGIWEGLEVDGRFRQNTGSKATFTIEIEEDLVSQWTLDFSLNDIIGVNGLSVSQQGELDGLLSDASGLGNRVAVGSFQSPTSGLSMEQAIDKVTGGSTWTSIETNPFTDIVAHVADGVNQVQNFSKAAEIGGNIIDGQFIANVYSHAFNRVFGKSISSVVGSNFVVNKPSGSSNIVGGLHPALDINLTGYLISVETGQITHSGNPSVDTSDGSKEYLFPYMKEPELFADYIVDDAGVTPAILGHRTLPATYGPSNFIIKPNSIIITSGGSGYDTTLIPPTFNWYLLDHFLYGKVSLDKQPDVSLLDIEHMTVTGKYRRLDNQAKVDLTRFHPSRIYRGGEFIFTVPTEHDIYGSVVFLKPQTETTSIDLQYFINPTLYPEYEHGLLQQLATDLCLHPYGNRYTEDWTHTEQKNTDLHMSSVTIGNNRVFTMAYNAESGNMGGWVPTDIGKVIRERDGSGEAIIVSIDTSNVRTPTFIDLVMDTGTLSIQSTDPGHVSGFGYADGSYSINVTSNNPLHTGAKLNLTVVNGSVELDDTLTLTTIASDFLTETSLDNITIHYEEITTELVGHKYPTAAGGSFAEAYLKDTADTATGNISRSFTTILKKYNLFNIQSPDLLYDVSLEVPLGDNWFEVGEWGVYISDDRIETQPYHLVYPNDELNPGHAIPMGESFYQQNHNIVTRTIATIGSTFIVESEKGTDILSSLADIVPGKNLLPGNLGHPHAISNIRKPQKWRIKFQFNDKDASLSVYVATAYQIQDDKTITRMQGRDGIKGTSVRLPGELCEVSYDLNTYNNKSKESFFNRRGKTNFDVENTYPMSYRLTCTDHGTALFIGDQAAIDQDDDYSWFVVQRHVNQVTGAIELEDGKSPVHCVYSPAKTVTEFSDFGQNYFRTFNRFPDEDGQGQVISTEGLDEQSIYDITGKELKLGSKTIINLYTHVDAVVPARYYQGVGFTNTTYHDGGLNPFSVELFNYANIARSSVTDLSILPLSNKGGDNSLVSEGTPGTPTVFTGGVNEKFHGMQTPWLDDGVATGPYTPSIFDRWFLNAEMDPSIDANTFSKGDLTATRKFDWIHLDPQGYFRTMMVDKIGKVGFNWLPTNTYEQVLLVNMQVAQTAEAGPAYQGLWPNRVWAYYGDDSGTNDGEALAPVHTFEDLDWDVKTQIFPKHGVNTSGENETLSFFQFDNHLTTWTITDDAQDIGEPLTSDAAKKGTRAWDTGVEVSLTAINSQEGKSGLYTFTFNCDGVADVTVSESTYGDWTAGLGGINKFVADCNLQLESNADTAFYRFFYITDLGPTTNMRLYFTKAGGPFASGTGGLDSGLGFGYNLTTPNITINTPFINLEVNSVRYGFFQSISNTSDAAYNNSSTITWTSSSDATDYGYASLKSMTAYVLEAGDVAVGGDFEGQTEGDTVYLPNLPIDPIAWKKGVTQTFNFGIEYQWKGAGTNGIYVNPYGKFGNSTKPVKDIARLTITVDGQELEMAPTDSMNYLINGEVVWPQDYTYQGTSLNSYIYYNDKLYLRYEVPNNTIVNLSYQNYSEDDITVQNSYMIKVAEDRDIPESWSNLHRYGKGIYRFVVRETDVLKPWDYHVSAVLPQIDSPAIINPMEQLSITQDKTFVFNFPTPMASQRYIYPASEMDMICYSGADSSIQGGYTEVGQVGNDKYSDDKIQFSSVSSGDVAPNAEPELEYRAPYSWHLDGDVVDGYGSILTDSVAGTANKKSHVDRRIYVGTYSTRPNGSGMRVFTQINGGSIRPEYSDNIDRKSL